MTAELLSCSFCGAHPASGFHGDEDGGYHYVECRSCRRPKELEAERFIGVHAESRADAIAAWNRRAPLQEASTHAVTVGDAILHAGRMLSNCAFNLAQRKPGEFTERDIQALHTACKAWDAALAARAAPGPADLNQARDDALKEIQ